MCTISNCEVISSVIKDPVTGCSCFVAAVYIPACHILCVCCDCYSLALAWLDHICFFIIQKLYCRFFYFVLNIIICIRNRSIKLYNILACNIASILNLYLGSYGSVFQIHIYTLESLLKCCIGKTISKRIRYFTVIIPCLACGTSYFCICISLTKYCIRISGLIIFVTCIDAFCFYLFCIDVYRRIRIGPCIVSKVLCCR